MIRYLKTAAAAATTAEADRQVRSTVETIIESIIKHVAPALGWR